MSLVQYLEFIDEKVETQRLSDLPEVTQLVNTWLVFGFRSDSLSHCF